MTTMKQNVEPMAQNQVFNLQMTRKPPKLASDNNYNVDYRYVRHP